jgi:hypothetical protein
VLRGSAPSWSRASKQRSAPLGSSLDQARPALAERQGCRRAAPAPPWRSAAHQEAVAGVLGRRGDVDGMHPKSQVRSRLRAGGKWIRTVGPTCGGGSLCRERDGNNGSSTDPARDCRSAYRGILTNVSPIAASIWRLRGRRGGRRRAQRGGADRGARGRGRGARPPAAPTRSRL